ncbi:hypothetical protein EBT23_06740, partial [bacterium]|nr:hypothetical protein [bacterium]
MLFIDYEDFRLVSCPAGGKFCLGRSSPGRTDRPQDEPIVKAVEKVRPAVVNIYTEGVVTQEVRDPRDIFFERYFGGGMSRG